MISEMLTENLANSDERQTIMMRMIIMQEAFKHGSLTNQCTKVMVMGRKLQAKREDEKIEKIKCVGHKMNEYNIKDVLAKISCKRIITVAIGMMIG